MDFTMSESWKACDIHRCFLIWHAELHNSMPGKTSGLDDGHVLRCLLDNYLSEHTHDARLEIFGACYCHFKA